LYTDVSKSTVATHLRCGGIFDEQLVTQSLLVWRWKNFENLLTFAKVMGKSIVSCLLFLTCWVVMWQAGNLACKNYAAAILEGSALWGTSVT